MRVVTTTLVPCAVPLVPCVLPLVPRDNRIRQLLEVPHESRNHQLELHSAALAHGGDETVSWLQSRST